MQIFISILLGVIVGFVPNKNKHNLNIERVPRKYFYEAVNLLKGTILVLFLKLVLNFELEPILIAMFFGLICSSFFNRFKFEITPGHFFVFGGFLFLIPLINLIWVIIWMIAFIYKKSIEFSFISSTLLTGLLSVTSSEVLNNEYWYTSPLTSNTLYFQILIGLLFALTIVSQLEYIQIYFGKTKTRKIK